jgi:preprotein translocase subunit SecF
MPSEKSIHNTRYDTSSRLHIIVLYLLIASLTIAWGIYFVHFSRNVQANMEATYAEFNLIKERLEALESTQITVTTNANGYDALRRQSRNTRIKTKAINNKQKAKQTQQEQQDQQQQQQQKENSDLLFGSIHFKIPVSK